MEQALLAAVAPSRFNRHPQALWEWGLSRWLGSNRMPLWTPPEMTEGLMQRAEMRPSLRGSNPGRLEDSNIQIPPRYRNQRRHLVIGLRGQACLNTTTWPCPSPSSAWQPGLIVVLYLNTQRLPTHCSALGIHSLALYQPALLQWANSSSRSLKILYG